MIVAQARLPCFYRDYGVPDTVNGRFDLIVLHLALVLARLSHENEGFRASGQELFDRFCLDMDHSLREMGIGDLKVPKEMDYIGKAFYGRSQAYTAALKALDDEPLIQALSRNVFGEGGGKPGNAHRLAAYVREAVGGLARHDAATLIGGAPAFPNPLVIPAPRL